LANSDGRSYVTNLSINLASALWFPHRGLTCGADRFYPLNRGLTCGADRLVHHFNYLRFSIRPQHLELVYPMSQMVIPLDVFGGIAARMLYLFGYDGLS